MTARSTRNKIRHQAQESLKAIDRIFVTLKNIDDLGENRSEYINTQLPILVDLASEVRTLFERFRAGL